MDGRRHGRRNVLGQLPGRWVKQAACGGRAELEPLFFIERGATSAAAKAICRTCPVRMECLEFALKTAQPHGVWGGLSERERRRIIRTRRRARAA